MLLVEKVDIYFVPFHSFLSILAEECAFHYKLTNLPPPPPPLEFVQSILIFTGNSHLNNFINSYESD